MKTWRQHILPHPTISASGSAPMQQTPATPGSPSPAIVQNSFPRLVVARCKSDTTSIIARHGGSRRGSIQLAGAMGAGAGPKRNSYVDPHDYSIRLPTSNANISEFKRAHFNLRLKHEEKRGTLSPRRVEMSSAVVAGGRDANLPNGGLIPPFFLFQFRHRPSWQRRPFVVPDGGSDQLSSVHVRGLLAARPPEPRRPPAQGVIPLPLRLGVRRALAALHVQGFLHHEHQRGRSQVSGRNGGGLKASLIRHGLRVNQMFQPTALSFQPPRGLHSDAVRPDFGQSEDGQGQLRPPDQHTGQVSSWIARSSRVLEHALARSRQARAICRLAISEPPTLARSLDPESIALKCE